MEICVIQNKRKKKVYGGSFSFGYLSILHGLLDYANFFNEDDFKDFVEWLNNEKSDCIGWYYVELKKIDDYISIYLTYTKLDFENCLEVEKEYLKEILKEWIEILKKNPREIVITFIDDEIKLKGRHFEHSKFDELDLKKCVFTDLPEKKIFSFNSEKIEINNRKSEVFCGGFHFEENLQKSDIDIFNESTLGSKVASIDFKFRDNLYLNHAFFPRDWNKEKIKNSILRILNNQSFERIEVENKVLSVVGFQEHVEIKVIINNKCEILAAYPISEYLPIINEKEK